MIFYFSCVQVCSSPVSIPQIKYGSLVGKISTDAKWSWSDVSSPITTCSEKVSDSYILYKVKVLFYLTLLLKVMLFMLRSFAGFISVGITTIWHLEHSSQGCLWESYKRYLIRCLCMIFIWLQSCRKWCRWLYILAWIIFLILLSGL